MHPSLEVPGLERGRVVVPDDETETRPLEQKNRGIIANGRYSFHPYLLDCDEGRWHRAAATVSTSGTGSCGVTVQLIADELAARLLRGKPLMLCPVCFHEKGDEPLPEPPSRIQRLL